MSQNRRPILFVSSPDPGLLNPLLVLAGELSRRGVGDLWFATDESRRGEIEAISVGEGATEVRFRSLGEVIPELSSGTWDDETYRSVVQPSRWQAHKALMLQTFHTRFRDTKYKALEAVVKEVEPALMVIDSIASWGFEVAITHQIPFVMSAPFPVSNVLHRVPWNFPVPHSGLPYEMTFRQRLANWWFRIRRNTLFHTNPELLKRIVGYFRANEELGVSRLAAKYTSKIDEAAMLFCYSLTGLDYPIDIPDHLHPLGAMIPPLPEVPGENDISSWLDLRESVVYMGFGTVTRLSADDVHNLVEVARRLEGNHHVLWRLPRNQQKFLPPAEELPANLRIEEWFPSQIDVLAHPHVKVFFTHGGGSGFHQGLYFGKPLVIRPLWIDCYDQAVRGRDAGVGLMLDRPEVFDPDDVVDKLTQVLTTDSFRQRAEMFAALQRKAGGRETAADLLLSLVEPGANAPMSPRDGAQNLRTSRTDSEFARRPNEETERHR
jgi:polyene glycosyltransferase